jgi:hypothetical protein
VCSAWETSARKLRWEIVWRNAPRIWRDIEEEVFSGKYYILWVSVYSLGYPACNSHAPYCHLWPVRHYYIFPHYLINGTIFGKKKLLNTNCVLIFSTTSVFKKNWGSYDKKTN